MNGNKKIRWGIIGAGRIARKFVNDLNLTKNSSLVAVASSDLRRAKSFATEFSIGNATNYSDFYSNPDIDAVYVATTHNSHFLHTKNCLENNKAVLCEKPITINTKECIQLQKIAKEKDVFLMEGLWTYFLPAVLKAKDWIKEGRIGKLRAIHANFGYAMEYNAAGRLFDPMLAGGALLDLGIYPVAISTYFTNEYPVSIIADSIFTDTGVDETTNVIMRYKDNATVLLFTSLAIKTLNSAFLYGDEGFIEIPDFFKASSARLLNADYQVLETFQDKRKGFGYEFQLQHVTDLLLTGMKESTIATHAISLKNQQIMMEIRNQSGLKYPMEK